MQPRKSAKPALGSHRVRIIGGQWKRTPLAVLDAEGLRPTPDRVRETVFNWLNHLLGGEWATVRCLDLFAGTGALGFEAASRGAREVVLIEDHAPAARQLEANKAKLGAAQVIVRRADALSTAQSLAAQAARYELIFLDPPYNQDWLVKILPLCAKLLAPGGLVYAEAEHPLDTATLPELDAWEIVRSDRAGAVFYSLLQRKTAPEIQA